MDRYSSELNHFNIFVFQPGSKQNLPLPNTEEAWTSRNNGEVTVRCKRLVFDEGQEARITT